MSLRRFVIAICVALTLTLTFAGNAFAAVPGLGAAKSFHRYPVYWAGEEVAGFPLEEISHGSGFTFFYGDCELAGTDHPSCAPPIQVQVLDICGRWPDQSKKKRLIPFRGAKASWYPGLKVSGKGLVEQGPLEIFTGRTTVVIYVEESDLKARSETKKIAFEVGAQLRTVHQTSPKPLPPPIPDSLAGKLPCQKTPTG